MKRISDEPAYVLHRYDWSESSLILEAFTRRHGRVALVAKGAKRPSSNFRPVLLPLQPLRLSFGGDAEIRTLKAAEWGGGHVMPTGEALLSGCYLNELMMRLLARDDAHPALFDAYAMAVQVLASGEAAALSPALRANELPLLREVGVLPALDAQTLTLAPLVASEGYALVPEAGLRRVDARDEDAESAERADLRGVDAKWSTGLSADDWLALQQALDDAAPLMATLRVCARLDAAAGSALKAQLRALLHYHCGVEALRTRQMMLELQSL
ncbi:MAG: DNA repair protein RecO [Burkholderiaceae bacterium]